MIEFMIELFLVIWNTILAISMMFIFACLFAISTKPKRHTFRKFFRSYCREKNIGKQGVLTKKVPLTIDNVYAYHIEDYFVMNVAMVRPKEDSPENMVFFGVLNDWRYLNDFVDTDDDKFKSD